MLAKKTSIKFRINLSLLSIAALRTVLGFIVIGIVIIPNIWQLEERVIKTALLRTTKALEQKIESLSNYADDWAYWDDTHRYLIGNEPLYEQSNLNDETLRVAKLGFMSLLTLDGDIVWGRYFKPNNDTTGYSGAPTSNNKWSKEFIAALQKKPMGMSGYFSSNLGVLYFVARPVLTSYKKGPSHGWIIVGRLLDDVFTTQFNTLMQQPIIFNSVQLDNIKTFEQQLNENINFHIKRLSITEISSMALINDYKNSPAFTVTINKERSLFIELWKIILIAIFCFIFIGIFSTSLIFHRIQKIIIDPLSDLANIIEHLGRDNIRLSQPKFTNGDEISLIYHRFRDVSGRLLKVQGALEKRTVSLEMEALTDPLTKLHNRRYLDRLMSKVSDNVFLDPSQKKLLFLIDIDHFKRLNDCYGHATGDIVLIQLAKILKSIVRDKDHVVRIGGEEFLIITDHLSIHDSKVLVERIKLCIENTNFISVLNEPLAVTASIGFSRFPLCNPAISGEDWRTALKLADYSLYQVKNSGRNGWCGYYTESLFTDIHLAMIPEYVEQLVESKILQPLTSRKNI